VVTLALSFRGPFSHDTLRDALRDALTALGAAPGEWSLLSHEARPDPNGLGGCFAGRWRLGDATLDASCVSGVGNPRDGYGYDHDVSLRWGDRALEWHGGGTRSAVDDFCPRLTASPGDFLPVRAALGRHLGDDHTDDATWARMNLRALDGVDRELQRTLLRAALSRASANGSASGDLRVWGQRFFGASLDE
jgi:hypothetical protein